MNDDFEDKITLFVKVALPLPLESFTYRVPFLLNNKIALGQMVTVYFGRKIKKLYGGIVLEINELPPKNFQASYIEDIIDEIPLINHEQLKFWSFLAQYYMCNMGDVMIAALPAGLRVNGESKIFAVKQVSLNENQLADDEIKILYLLEQNAYLTIDDIQKKYLINTPLKYIKSLYEKGLVNVEEEVTKTYKPKRKTMLKLDDSILEEKNLESCLAEIGKKSEKQITGILFFIQNGNASIAKNDFINETGLSSAVIKTLIDKKILVLFYEEESRIPMSKEEINTFKLTILQQEAVAEINQYFLQKKPVLLFGPTASGKTFVYLDLIKAALAKGKQVLYLLPEIALTEQMIVKLSKYLGNEILVTHSKYSQNERAETWELLRSKVVNVIVGPRSAIFSPFFNLDLIIVDEEHESSFKQNDKAPRFNGRDAAIKLAQIWGANIVLGSATPSLESMHAAKQKKYGLVTLTEKFNQAGSLNFIEINMSVEKEKNKVHSMLSFDMLNAIKKTIEEKKQVIVFHNRKGFVPITSCTTCGWIPTCINCDISLTYYKYSQEMRCHCCGYKSKVPSVCMDCGGGALQTEGYGTEKITEDLIKLLPEASIERFDQESTRKKNAQKNLIKAFENNEINILVGTQLLAKGFDFDDVDLVCVVNTDHMLFFPDFRAGERTFQLITQVAGRAGRRDRIGKVILQTQRSNHPIIQAIKTGDYDLMFENEISSRSNFLYPPFSRLIHVQIKNFDPLIAEKGAIALANALKIAFGNRALGPSKPIIAKVRRWYLRDILIKMHKESDDIVSIKNALKQTIAQFIKQSAFKGLRIVINVDPY